MTARDQRIIADARISVERSYTDEWNLYIRDVEHTDAGKYMCQINTNPVKIKYVMLLVHGKTKNILRIYEKRSHMTVHHIL